MLLEVQVFGSEEWFEQVYPMFKPMGFTEREDLVWADPETDGELTGHYFEYTKKAGIPVDEFHVLIKDMEKIIMEGEAPYIKFNLVENREPVKIK